MTADETNSLADQAAAWVPPWARQPSAAESRPRAAEDEAEPDAEADPPVETLLVGTPDLPVEDTRPDAEVVALPDSEPASLADTSADDADIDADAADADAADADAADADAADADAADADAADADAADADAADADAMWADRSPSLDQSGESDSAIGALDAEVQDDAVVDAVVEVDTDGEADTVADAVVEAGADAGAVAVSDESDISGKSPTSLETLVDAAPQHADGIPADRPPSLEEWPADPDTLGELLLTLTEGPAEPTDLPAEPTDPAAADEPAEPTDLAAADGPAADEAAEPTDLAAADGPAAGEFAEQTALPIAEEPKVELTDDELRGAVEAILLIIDEPATEIVLAQVLDQPVNRISGVLERVSREYTEMGRGFELRRVAGGWRLYTRPEYAAYVEKFVLDGQQVRLTQAALETLAVVAYKQPVTRSRISAIRGVNCDGVIRTLVARGLIEECGSEPESGAFLYRTTILFLEKLGLDSVEQLPPLAPFLPDDVDEIADAQR